MSLPQAVATPAAVPDVASLAKSINDSLASLTARQEATETQLKSIAEQSAKLKGDAPWARRGEDPNTSRGFSFVKLFGVMAGQIPNDYAKVEFDLCSRIRAAYDQQGGIRDQANSVNVPFSADMLSETHRDNKLADEVRQCVKAGGGNPAGVDLEEAFRIREKYWGRQKALSWIDETSIGSVVGPPQFGELIEVFRNNEIFIQAGARVMGMPPNGRMQWPRQTGAATAYHVGESTQITESAQTTGDLILQAKKMGVLVKLSNELFRYASISVEQFVREDMARVMALKMDKTLLDDVGSTYVPKGLINYSQITPHTATTVGGNGNTFEAVDVAQMIGKVEEQNAVFKAFIMRPLMYTALSNRRSSVYDGATTVAEGPFLFNMWRNLQEQYIDPTRQAVGNLNGYPVYKSTQVSNTRAKGGASDLTYILGGDFADFMIALSGTMEFALAREATDAFIKDQTWFRGILHYDGAPRHEASFALCDTLVVA